MNAHACARMRTKTGSSKPCVMDCPRVHERSVSADLKRAGSGDEIGRERETLAVWRPAVNVSKFTRILNPKTHFRERNFISLAYLTFNEFVRCISILFTFDMSLCGQAPANRIETFLFVFSVFPPRK